jgi:hypothetical protein
MQHGLLAVVNRTGEDFVFCFEAYEIYFRPTRKAAAASSARADSYSDGASINDMQASPTHTCSRKFQCCMSGEVRRTNVQLGWK